MGQLQTYDLRDVRSIEHREVRSPGDLVSHVEDGNSLGTVVAIDRKPSQFKVESRPQVTVLWAKEPLLIEVQTTTINAVSRPLRTKWSVEEEATIHGANFSRYVSIKPEVKIEEEYLQGDLNDDQLKEMRERGDDITFHSDGRLVVNRRADTPPDNLRGPDETFQSYYRRC